MHTGFSAYCLVHRIMVGTHVLVVRCELCHSTGRVTRKTRDNRSAEHAICVSDCDHATVLVDAYTKAGRHSEASFRNLRAYCKVCGCMTAESTHFPARGWKQFQRSGAMHCSSCHMRIAFAAQTRSSRASRIWSRVGLGACTAAGTALTGGALGVAIGAGVVSGITGTGVVHVLPPPLLPSRVSTPVAPTPVAPTPIVQVCGNDYGALGPYMSGLNPSRCPIMSELICSEFNMRNDSYDCVGGTAPVTALLSKQLARYMRAQMVAHASTCAHCKDHSLLQSKL